jgi:DNA replication and repair protein RecF
MVLVVGPNGAGKTNLLESLHVGTQGFSPRTRSDVQLIRFGAPAGRILLRGRHGKAPMDISVKLSATAGKQAELNGARLRAAEQLRSEVPTLVFTPDRLVVVKGAPATRRAYFDRVTGRLAPARAGLSAEYGAAVGQRNASLRRAASGLSTPAAVAPWTERVAALGAALVEARQDTIARLGPGFAARGAELGLDHARLGYEAVAPSVEVLNEALERDLDRGTTSLGPHLDDVMIGSGDRDLRAFGSQGEQRLAVLSLLLAEAELISDSRGETPLLLLDDVLSELDTERRKVLVEQVRRLGGQVLLTATSAEALPAAPDVLVEVTPGQAVQR